MLLKKKKADLAQVFGLRAEVALGAPSQIQGVA